MTTPLRATRRRLVTALVLLGLALTTLGAGPRPEDEEGEVKANILLRFAGMVTWPEEAFEDEDAPFVVGILGEDVFDGALDAAAAEKETHAGRPLVVEHYATLDEVDCHMLFVGSVDVPEDAEEGTDEDDVLEALFERAAEGHVFTVSGLPGFARTGGVMRLFLVDGRHDFEINRANAKAAGLVISAHLLKLATLVGDD